MARLDILRLASLTPPEKFRRAHILLGAELLDPGVEDLLEIVVDVSILEAMFLIVLKCPTVVHKEALELLLELGIGYEPHK